MKKTVLSFCNQPIFHVGEKYYTPHANFIDFLCCWTLKDSQSRVMVPIFNAKLAESHWVELNINKNQVLRALAYRTHIGAFVSGIVNAVIFRWHVYRFDNKFKGKLRVVLPGSNAFSSVFSMIINKRIASISMPVVRGNTLNTISHMYASSWLKFPAVLAARFFLQRLKVLQRKGSTALCFGDDLTALHKQNGRALTIFPLIESISNSVQLRDAIKGGHATPNFTMLYVGRLSNEKGVLELLEAAEALVDKEYKFSLLIAGHGPLEDEVLERIKTSKLKCSLRFLGRLAPGAEVLETIDQADLLLLPSKTEGVPRVIVESLSRRVPVLTTSVGGIARAFGESVSYFKSPEVADLIIGIEAALSQSANKQALEPMNDVLEEFTFDSNIARIEQIG